MTRLRLRKFDGGSKVSTLLLVLLVLLRNATTAFALFPLLH
jgi:hypothetical protein